MNNDLWSAIGALACELHADRLRSIANHIGKLKSHAEFDRVRHAFGPNFSSESLDRLQRLWHKEPSITPGELAAALHVAAECSNSISSMGSSELVWTGPKTSVIPARSTEQVVLQVVGAARERLFITSFNFSNASSVVAALNAAHQRAVEINILLELAQKDGGTLGSDSLAAMRAAVPAARLFYWDPLDRGPGWSCSHAKCTVADNRIAFITSANLSDAAMERNMELGVLFRHGRIPDCLHSHLEALVENKIIREYTK
jgi:cardiolipin synthase A/B